MAYKLRDYQAEAVQSVFDYYHKASGNPIIALPTGTGKALVNAGFLERVVKQWPGQRILCLTHVSELIQQNYEKFCDMCPTLTPGVYSAGLKRKDKNESIIFAGIQSVAKKAVVFGHIDLIIIDECHLVSPNAEASYGRFIEDLMLINPHLKVIGLTATPYRLGLGLMTNGQIFTDICYDKTSGDDFVWFVKQGYLSNLVPKPTKTQFNLDGVKLRGSEFEAKGLQEAVDKQAITEAAIQETIEVGTSNKRMKWMFFTTGEEHGQHVTDYLIEQGIETRFVHSKMNYDRTEAIEWFKAPSTGTVKALVNIDTLTTGFDCTDLDLLVMLRPTMSPGLWVQILGRGTRPHYAKGYDLSTQEGRLAAIAASVKPSCMVLDFAGNTARLGPINRVEIPRKKGKGGGPAPAKICPMCTTYVWAAATICEHCGHEFPPPRHKLNNNASTDTLVAGVAEQFDIRHVDVSSVSYRVHNSKSGTPTMKVSYLCGMVAYHEYVCVEHTGGARFKAESWWRERTANLLPPTAAEGAVALAHSGLLRMPGKLAIRFDQKYPEILKGYNFEEAEVLDEI